ncbi:MerR family transcriptional regulator [Actinomadura rudentiformis]
MHQWDTIGLVRPSGRAGVGYRVYSDDDVARSTGASSAGTRTSARRARPAHGRPGH